LKEVFRRIAEEYEFHIDTMEVMEDHVHVFVEAPPGYSPAQLVQVFKSISAREVYKKFPKMRREMWSGKIWSDGYFVRSVGDKVTADVIRRYIEYQKQEENPEQLRMFEKTQAVSPACWGVRHFSSIIYKLHFLTKCVLETIRVSQTGQNQEPWSSAGSS
jgi:putative transposase